MLHVKNLDIDVNVFLEICNASDVEEILEYLIDHGYIKSDRLKDRGRISYGHEEYLNAIEKLSNLYHRLPNEESDKIVELAKKY